MFPHVSHSLKIIPMHIVFIGNSKRYVFLPLTYIFVCESLQIMYLFPRFKAKNTANCPQDVNLLWRATLYSSCSLNKRVLLYPFINAVQNHYFYCLSVQKSVQASLCLSLRNRQTFSSTLDQPPLWHQCWSRRIKALLPLHLTGVNNRDMFHSLT